MKPTASKTFGFAAELLKRRMKPLAACLLLAAFLSLGLPASPLAQQAPPRPPVPPQAPLRLRDIRRISVEEFGRSDLAQKIQERVIAGIIQSGRLQVVSASATPDASLVGAVISSPELTVKVRLTTRGHRELWSHEVQSPTSNSGNQADVAANIAKRIVKQLLRAIEEDRSRQ